MEQIELVIKMPKEYYDLLMSGRFYLCGARGNGKTVTSEVMKSICTSVVLPKGHDALIDRKNVIDVIDWYRLNPQHFSIDNVIDDIKCMEFLVEADKEGAEE